MTKEESFRYSIELWEWLTDNPLKEKREHPTLPVNKWSGECAFCEMDTTSICNECPMRNNWPGEEGLITLCHDSVFMDWDLKVGFSYDRSFFAAVLVEAFKKRFGEGV